MAPDTLTSLYKQILRSVADLKLDQSAATPQERDLGMAVSTAVFELRLWAFDERHQGRECDSEELPTNGPTTLLLLDQLYDREKTKNAKSGTHVEGSSKRRHSKTHHKDHHKSKGPKGTGKSKVADNESQGQSQPASAKNSRDASIKRAAKEDADVESIAADAVEALVGELHERLSAILAIMPDFSKAQDNAEDRTEEQRTQAIFLCTTVRGIYAYQAQIDELIGPTPTQEDLTSPTTQDTRDSGYASFQRALSPLSSYLSESTRPVSLLKQRHRRRASEPALRQKRAAYHSRSGDYMVWDGLDPDTRINYRRTTRPHGHDELGQHHNRRSDRVYEENSGNSQPRGEQRANHEHQRPRQQAPHRSHRGHSRVSNPICVIL